MIYIDKITKKGSQNMDDNRFKAVFAVVVALVLIPVINSFYGIIPAAAAILAAAAAIIVLIVLGIKKPDKKGSGIETELCSDIRSISLNARGKNYVVSEGAGFSIDDNLQTGLMSYIENGVWRIEDNGETGDAPVEIRIPESFIPEVLDITAEKGNIISFIPFAGLVRINNYDGETDIRKICANEFYAENGRGKINITSSLSGSARFVCGSGSIRVNLENEAEEFNAEAMTGMGNIRIGNEVFGSERRRGKIENNAEKNIEVSCGMGSVEIDFGGQDTI